MDDLGTIQQRIAKALDIAQDGALDGAEHKHWVIDQMIRALTGCPMVEETALDYRGQPYTYEAQGESEKYLEWVRAFCEGEEGPDTYSWETGIAP